MASQEKDLNELFLDTLKDIYYAEKQILKALPKMAKAASAEELRTAFSDHLEETRGQVTRLEKIFKNLDVSPKGKKCKGMEGLIEEGQEMLEEDAEPEVLDAGLIAGAQRAEHYEMAAYGAVRNYAETLGFSTAADLLQQTLDEEKQADQKLTELAEGFINNSAENGSTTAMRNGEADQEMLGEEIDEDDEDVEVEETTYILSSTVEEPRK